MSMAAAQKIRAVAVQVPILGGSVPRKTTESVTRKAIERASQWAIVKPLRRLGASWTSDKVHQRNVVTMCEPCWRRYYQWWRRAHYRPDWGWRYWGDCDGCSITNGPVTLFHAEEKFYDVLAPTHGRNPKP